MKPFGPPPPLSKIIPPPFFNYPPISEQCFHDPPICPNFKNEISPPNFFFFGGGGGNYIYIGHGTSNHVSRQTKRLYVHNPKETFVVLWASTVNSKFSYSFGFSVYLKLFYSISPGLPDVIKFPKESSPNLASNIK